MPTALGELTEAESALPDEYSYGGRVPNAIGAATLVCAGAGRFGGLGEGLLNLLYKFARTRGNRVDGSGNLAEEGHTFVGLWHYRLPLVAASATDARTRLNYTGKIVYR
ncbi:MAG: hypothetical protein SGPRY_014020 [Prymnesium sp.]